MKVLVHVDIAGQPQRAGVLYAEARRGRLTSAFAYDGDYIASSQAYAVDPALPLAAGTWPSAAELPRAFRDAAPDRWGRQLISRRAAAEAQATGVQPRTLTELDYLLGVSDAARQGALRFKTSEDGPFEHPLADVPRLVALPTLLAASRSVAEDRPNAPEAVATLFNLGSASLGGAMPKASVLDDGILWVAKFGHPSPPSDAIAWEKTALDLAESAGIRVPDRRLLDVEGAPVLLAKRFDRGPASQRLGYISAMTLCEANDGEPRDYLEIADRLAAITSAPQDDLAELWRRVAFGIAINNTDDHLRNHGFLHDGAGWRLSPVFDVNPDPNPAAPRATSIAGAVTAAASMAALAASRETYGLSAAQVRRIMSEVAQAVGAWRRVAASNGIPPTGRDRLAPTFEQGLAVLAS